MHIFTPAYFILALASWSALAAPIPRPSKDGDEQSSLIFRLLGLHIVALAVQKQSFSSNLMSREYPQPYNSIYEGIGPAYPIVPKNTTGVNGTVTPVSKKNNSTSTSDDSTMDCNKGSDAASKGDDKTDDDKHVQTTGVDLNSSPTTALPLIARRRSRGLMRRGHKASKAPSIFDRDDLPSATGTTNKPITFGDALANYLQQRRTASRKRATRSRG